MIHENRYGRFAALGIGLAVCLMAASCGKEETGIAVQGADSLRAFVEGMIVPERDSFDVVLTRGDGELRTRSHAGYFQFSGVPYGMYILDVSGKGYGGFRRLISIRERNYYQGGISMETVPWPLEKVYPSDSMVFTTDRLSGLVQFGFSRKMNRQSVEQALHVNPSIPYELTWEERRQFDDLGDNLTLSVNLNAMEYGRAYTVALDTSAETGLGANLERPVSRTLINRIATSGNGLAVVGSRSASAGPRDSIPIYFSKSMVRSSVPARLVVAPSVAYATVWDEREEILYLVPGTRWPPASSMEVRLNSGYEAQDGTKGQDAAANIRIDRFSVVNLSVTGVNAFTGQLEMRFNMPIVQSSLRYRVAGGSASAIVQAAPDRLLWTFAGVTLGLGFSLSLDTVISQFGDSLRPGKVFLLEPKATSAAFRDPDSTRHSAGLSPWRDTLRLHSLWATYSRLKESTFVLSPAYPFISNWKTVPFDTAILEIAFPQPIPSGTTFKLMPADGPLAGDTVTFRTRFLAARPFRPYEGEQLVRPDEPIILDWNAAIDTVGFASRLTFEPAAASLAITQDTVEGGIRTTIRHSPLAPATAYTVMVMGAADVFARPMADTLTLRFKTRP